MDSLCDVGQVTGPQLSLYTWPPERSRQELTGPFPSPRSGGCNLTESVKVKCSFRIFLNTVPPKQLLSVHQGLARMHFLHLTELLGHKQIHLVTPQGLALNKQQKEHLLVHSKCRKLRKPYESHRKEELGMVSKFWSAQQKYNVSHML